MEKKGLAGLFPYYAGFAFEWAEYQMQSLAPHHHVLDPWNGSGTTTLAAAHLGITAVGTDLNPVANTVALLKLRGRDVVPAPRPATRHHLLCPPPRNGDPLDNWFDPRTRNRLRLWLAASRGLPVSTRLLLKVALFRVVRDATPQFQTSNPTWVRRTRGDDDLIHVAEDQLDATIDEHQASIAHLLAAECPRPSRASVIRASAAVLPFYRSIDRVLTSPPYMTRIDYAIAYSRELAVLGIDVWRDRSFRMSLMGSTLIRDPHMAGPLCRSSIANDTWAGIASHVSKDSAGYYARQASQYLSDMNAALHSITLTTKPGAEMTLVIQDSTYKEQHLPLSDIWPAEAREFGWTLRSKVSFPVLRSLLSLNAPAQRYVKPPVSEAVIHMRLETKEMEG